MTERLRLVATTHADLEDRALHSPVDRHGLRRRTEFRILEERFGADVVGYDLPGRPWWVRWLKRVHPDLPLALTVFGRRAAYDRFICLSETEGLMLALLFKLVRSPRRVDLIGPEITSRRGLFALQRLGAETHVASIMPMNLLQADLLLRLGVDPEKVRPMPHQIDTRFFDPARSSARAGDYILAVGREGRDYATLLAAVEGLDTTVLVCASSLWATRDEGITTDLPTNVELRTASYEELRELYAGALFVVIPLRESPYQHGVTTLEESMSMAKAVIASRIEGQGDLLADRRRVLRSRPQLSTCGAFARLYAADDQDLWGPTGTYVTPGDPVELRRAIDFLLAHPEQAADMGRRGRAVAEAVFDTALFVDRLIAGLA
jgi:glycosyltransferase involved in cell wall biosynthesis